MNDKGRPRQRITLRRRILSYVMKNPGQTATLIARALGAKLASVASDLHKFTKKGMMSRRVGGVRGGYVYFRANR
jgi:predicted transcriptional regulator